MFGIRKFFRGLKSIVHETHCSIQQVKADISADKMKFAEIRSWGLKIDALVDDMAKCKVCLTDLFGEVQKLKGVKKEVLDEIDG